MATFNNLGVLAYTHVAASVAVWIVLAFLSGCNAELTAQTESWGKNSQLLVRSWGVTSENQLQSIAAMLQTRDGYLWIGTSKGVVRFDGVRFSAFAYATTPGKSLLDAKQASVTVEVLTPFYKSWWMKDACCSWRLPL